MILGSLIFISHCTIVLTLLICHGHVFTGGASSAEPRRLASLGSLLDDQHWHRLSVERRGLHLNVTVDQHTEKVRMPAEFSHWDVQQVQ